MNMTSSRIVLASSLCAALGAIACKGDGDRSEAAGDKVAKSGGGKAREGGGDVAATPAPAPTPVVPLPADPGDRKKGAHQWSVRMGGPAAESGRAVAVDPKGNVYLTGLFRETVDFGDGVPLTADGVDGFVARYAEGGKLRWVKRLGGKQDDIADAVAVDPQGNVVVTGSFSFSLEVGDGKLESKGADDLFVVKLDPDGKRVWGKRLGGNDVDAGQELAIDAKGNIAVIGVYSQDVEVGKETLYGVGDTDILLTVLSPEGHVLWSRGWASMGADEGRAVGFDAQGNLYVLAEFSREVDFGGGPLKSAGNRDLVLMKLDPLGVHLWSRRFGGQLDELGQGLAVDPSGSVVIVGSFDDVLDLGDGAPMRTAGRSDVFVAKFDPDGKTAWARQLGDKDEDIGASVATDPYGNVYAAGWFWRELVLGADKHKSAGKKDMFLLALKPNGDPLWSRTFGSKEDDYARGLAVHASALYLTGTFHLGINLGGTDLTAAAAPKAPLPLGDAFVAKFAR